ncbi:hypothetical protein LOK49_LG08G00137 [Camellia lanceoleosa]|uniref:Uncharacterized protein n=1 Tax=Camellia lanceoleosa TaxID=1840588 RepID=A0ACC0GP00_9ERIC|nr:hypothetical protein LOK49_LG08G00137 [Camellia lanceoleosa]
MLVPMAIALSGQPLLGQPVMVKPSEAEKNLVQSIIATAGVVGGLIGPYLGGSLKSMFFSIEVRNIFYSFLMLFLIYGWVAATLCPCCPGEETTLVVLPMCCHRPCDMTIKKGLVFPQQMIFL